MMVERVWTEAEKREWVMSGTYSARTTCADNRRDIDCSVSHRRRHSGSDNASACSGKSSQVQMGTLRREIVYQVLAVVVIRTYYTQILGIRIHNESISSDVSQCLLSPIPPKAEQLGDACG